MAAGTAALLLIRHFSPFIAVPGRYSTIQAAIDAARDGKIIVVEPGLYQENIDFKGKAVTLRSADPDDPEVVAATILDSGGSGSVVTFQNGEGEEAVLSGFTITGGGGGGIAVWGASATITGNTISGNRAASGSGIYVGANSSVFVEENTISGNKTEQSEMP